MAKLVVLAIIYTFMYLAAAKTIYSTDSVHRSSVLASHQWQRQAKNKWSTQEIFSLYNITPDVTFDVFKNLDNINVDKNPSFFFDENEKAFYRTIIVYASACIFFCNKAERYGEERYRYNCTGFYQLITEWDFRIWWCCTFSARYAGCGLAQATEEPGTMNQQAATDREHIGSDYQEVGLYFLRTDKTHEQGPQDFLSFNSSNMDILNYVAGASLYTVVAHGFVDDSKKGYEVFREQNLLDIAYEYFKRGRFVLLLDWTEHTGKTYPYAVDRVFNAGERARAIFKNLINFDVELNCVGYELGASVCSGFGSVDSINRIDQIAPTSQVVRGTYMYTAIHLCIPYEELRQQNINGQEAHFFYTELCPQCSSTRTPFFDECYNVTDDCYKDEGISACVLRNCVSAFHKALQNVYHAQYLDANRENSGSATVICRFGPHAEPKMHGAYIYYDSCGQCYFEHTRVVIYN